MDFPEWVSAKLGTRQWVVAHRLTDRLKGKGYTLAITRKRLHDLEDQWLVEHPTALLASIGQRKVLLLARAGLLREPPPHSP